LSVLYSYNLFVGRFLLVPVALTMPLAAWLRPYRLLSGALAATGIVTLAFCLALNHTKPAGVDESVSAWSLGRPEAQSITRQWVRDALVWADLNLPPRARVGVLLSTDDWDYPLYGPRLTRKLVPLPDRQPLRETRRLGLRWVVLSGLRSSATAVTGWNAVTFPRASWIVLSRPGADPTPVTSTATRAVSFRAV
jgi:hypothetical protein